jgi:hypothetical protein
MMSKAGWYIASTNNQRNSPYIFTKKTYLGPKGNLLSFYVVTPDPTKIVRNAASARGTSVRGTERTSNPVTAEEDDRQIVDLRSLDYSGMASMMSLQLGVSVTEEAMQAVVAKNIPTRENLSGKTTVVVQSEDTLTTMTAVDRNYSTTVSNPCRHDPRTDSLLFGDQVDIENRNADTGLVVEARLTQDPDGYDSSATTDTENDEQCLEKNVEDNATDTNSTKRSFDEAMQTMITASPQRPSDLLPPLKTIDVQELSRLLASPRHQLLPQPKAVVATHLRIRPPVDIQALARVLGVKHPPVQNVVVETTAEPQEAINVCHREKEKGKSTRVSTIDVWKDILSVLWATDAVCLFTYDTNFFCTM